MTTVLLLLASNTFMTIAWYAHLGGKFKSLPVWQAVLFSWLIAFFEYCLQVPANKIGDSQGFNKFQLKVVAEATSIVVFIVFAKLYFGINVRWNHVLAFGLILGAVYFAFLPSGKPG